MPERLKKNASVLVIKIIVMGATFGQTIHAKITEGKSDMYAAAKLTIKLIIEIHAIDACRMPHCVEIVRKRRGIDGAAWGICKNRNGDGMHYRYGRLVAGLNNR